jgi:hypothetical protein
MNASEISNGTPLKRGDAVIRRVRLQSVVRVAVSVPSVGAYTLTSNVPIDVHATPLPIVPAFLRLRGNHIAHSGRGLSRYASGAKDTRQSKLCPPEFLTDPIPFV